jgi:hypothetical protein
MSTPQNTIAIVYDYDLTLSPNYMQEEVIFPAFGIDSRSFWKKSHELVKDLGFDNELAYMKLLLDCLGIDRPTNARLRELGGSLRFYPGLPEMFHEFQSGLLKPHHESLGIQVEHYIISSGLKILIEGSRIAPFVKAIFGCEFAEDETGRISFPKRVISHTQKTQYLFRINKGLLSMNEDVNDHMPESVRPVPFRNMIYIGDGPTDVHADRVRHIAPADFRAGSHLRLVLENMIEEIANKIVDSHVRELESVTVRAPKHSV